MPSLSFSSNDIDVITGKKRRTIRKLWKTPLKKATDYTVTGISFQRKR